MRHPDFTNRFRKDIKRQKKRGKHRQKIQSVIEHICAYGDAPRDCRPHKLSGNWDGYWECHIEPDWLLIYRIEEESVAFVRTGSHSDLFR